MSYNWTLTIPNWRIPDERRPEAARLDSTRRLLGCRARRAGRRDEYEESDGRGHEPTPATTNPQIELFLLCVFVLTAKYEQYRAGIDSSGHKILEVKFVSRII